MYYMLFLAFSIDMLGIFVYTPYAAVGIGTGTRPHASVNPTVLDSLATSSEECQYLTL
jgi:hypothetical protein